MVKPVSQVQTQTPCSDASSIHKTKDGALRKKKRQRKPEDEEEIRSSNGRTTEKRRKKEKVKEKEKKEKEKKKKKSDGGAVQWQDLSYQATWLSSAFSSACESSSLSHLEQGPPLTADNLVQLQMERERDSQNLYEHVKSMFGDAWSTTVQDIDSSKEKGSPSLLILCSSAIRCVELLKGLRSLTTKCKPVKLFAKHIKVEEQVKALEDHVNIAVGTPNRVKKLLDIGALGVNALSVVVVDMFEDAKGFTLFTIPQVKADFWELYKDHLHQQIIDNKVKVCLY